MTTEVGVDAVLPAVPEPSRDPIHVGVIEVRTIPLVRVGDDRPLRHSIRPIELGFRRLPQPS